MYNYLFTRDASFDERIIIASFGFYDFFIVSAHPFFPFRVITLVSFFFFEISPSYKIKIDFPIFLGFHEYFISMIKCIFAAKGKPHILRGLGCCHWRIKSIESSYIFYFQNVDESVASDKVEDIACIRAIIISFVRPAIDLYSLNICCVYFLDAFHPG